MSTEAQSNTYEHSIAADAFDKAYAERHSDYTLEQVQTIRENSGLPALVRGEDLPLGSIALVSSRGRRERARKIGKRYGGIKD